MIANTLIRLEEKIDNLKETKAKKLQEDQIKTVIHLILKNTGRKMLAMQIYIELTGCSLTTSKNFVENLI